MFEPQKITYTDDNRYAVVTTLMNKSTGDSKIEYYAYHLKDKKVILDQLEKLERVRVNSVFDRQYYQPWDKKDKDVAIVEYKNGKVNRKTYFHPIDDKPIYGNGDQCRKYKVDQFNDDGSLEASIKYYPVVNDNGMCTHYKYCERRYQKGVIRSEDCYDESVVDSDGNPLLHAEGVPAVKEFNQAGHVLRNRYYMHGIEVDPADLGPEIQAAKADESTVDATEDTYEDEPEPEEEHEDEPEPEEEHEEEPEPESEGDEDSDHEDDETLDAQYRNFYINYDDGMRTVQYYDNTEMMHKLSSKKCAPYMAVFSINELYGKGPVNRWVVLATEDSFAIKDIMENRSRTLSQMRRAIETKYTDKL